jgi:DNA polymerase-3 subunit epsilon
MRQVVLDTETTGLEVQQRHRVIEIGCVELLHRRLTGRVFHRYLNPERDIDEGAQQVHGLSRERLEKEPTFAQVAAEFLDFIHGAELIIHNAPFDVAFLNAELALLAAGGAGSPERRIQDLCRVLDTLALARQMHPGQRNNLDALCKRYAVDNSERDYHGALLDARILAGVYLAMTGGQTVLTLGVQTNDERARFLARDVAPARPAAGMRLAVVRANPDELRAHEQILDLLDQASGGRTVWRRGEAGDA